MAAGGEEVVVDADRRQAEGVGEQPAEDLLDGVARGPAVGGRADAGGGQRAPVQLAVRGQRQGAEWDDRGGHHVLDEVFAHVAEQFGSVQDPRLGGYGVGHQALVAGPVLADDDRGLGDGGVADQHGLDLAEFDAVAAELDLLVRAAQEDDLAVLVPGGQVAGAVHAAAGRSVRVGGEPLGRQGRQPAVALGEVRSSDVELTGFAGGGVAQFGVQDVHGGVRHRDAEVEPVEGAHLGGEGLVAAEDGRLGGTVDVHERGVRAVVQGPLEGDAGQDVAAGPDLAQLPQPVERLAGHGVEEGGREVGGGHLVAGDGLGQFADVDLRGGQHDGQSAAQQGNPQLVGGGVEGQRRVGEHPLVGRGAEARVQGQFDDVAVGVDDALGGAAGAGGEHDVQRLVGVDRDAGCRGRAAGRGAPVVEPQDGQVRGEVRLPGRTVGHQQGGLGVAEDPAETLLGLAGVQGYVHAAALQHGEDRDDVGERAVEEEADGVAGPYALGDEPVCEGVGRSVQLPVGETAVLADERDGLRGTGGLGGEESVQRTLGKVLCRVVVRGDVRGNADAGGEGWVCLRLGHLDTFLVARISWSRGVPGDRRSHGG
ncbi:hypothetical protein EES39_39945 [Streptomyces sp. ADI92-24]|nr:hypothetical protein EES39_39945 [Streptomyces sp. ADI92-24]